MPKPSLGKLIDDIYDLDKEIDKRQRAIAVIDAERKKLLDQLIHRYKKEDINGAAGSTAKASISYRNHVNVKSWPKLYAYIKANSAWDMLQRRASSKAYMARVEQGVRVPGCQIFKELVVSIRGKR